MRDLSNTPNDKEKADSSEASQREMDKRLEEYEKWVRAAIQRRELNKLRKYIRSV